MGDWRSGDAPEWNDTARRSSERGGVLADLEVGAVIDGTVSRITPYGAFLTLEGGKMGLVHISEIDR
ncbi:MAG TPA: S1 RNA-binding domain-containing protein, partial [Gemmatimonadales bacterium]